jgi:hypothetical protein
MRTLLLAIVVPVLIAPAARAFEPTRSYEVRQIEGWTVRVSSTLRDEHRDVADRALELLRVRLFELKRALPGAALDRLRDVTFWMEWDDPSFPGMCFHPSAGWLRAHGFNPDKAGGIEIGNARHFIDWSSEQPCMVLHEFAHAYQHKVLGGADNAEIRAAYERARRGGKYDAVLRAGGRTERAYALTNPEEFFAELSESYFGTNDFYPFVRAELRQYDRDSFELIRRLWTAPPPQQQQQGVAHAPAAPATTAPTVASTRPAR